MSDNQPLDDFRFHCTNANRLKRKSKLLRKIAAARGYEFSLSRCQNIISAMYGFKHLNDFQEHFGAFDRSLDDEDVDQDTLDRRFWFQVDKLIEAGVSSA